MTNSNNQQRYMEYVRETIHEYGQGLIKVSPDLLLTLARATLADEFMTYAAMMGNEGLPDADESLLENECRDLFHLMNVIECGLQWRLLKENKHLPAPKVRTALQMLDAYTKGEDFNTDLMQSIYNDLAAHA